MHKKHCPKCGRFSYSAKCSGTWQCPTCGTELSSKKLRPIDSCDRSEGQNGHPELHLIIGGRN